MNSDLHLEQSMAELEKIVRLLEKGDLPLEEALQQFEKGVHLTKHCQKILKNAEQKIETLTASSVEFNLDEPSGD